MSDAPFQDFSINSGIVQGTDDPTKQGRVLVTVAGKIEPAKWAHCVMPGSPFSNGMYVVPALRSQVAVAFMDGDRDQPIVLGGFAPPVLGAGARAQTASADLPKMITIENDDWVLMLGKSETNAPYFDLRSRPKEDGTRCRIVLDFDQQILEIDIPQAITIKTAGLLNLDGRLMQLRERPVEEGSQPV